VRGVVLALDQHLVAVLPTDGALAADSAMPS
jgi:hypothetical protein